MDIATDRQVFNLACSGATIRAGILEPQRVGSLTVPAQLPRAVASGPSAIIINVGANDVNWSGILRICTAMQNCRNAAVDAYFEQQLAGFTREYLALLTQLRSMPNPPAVVVNLYYNPLDRRERDTEPAQGQLTDRLPMREDGRDVATTIHPSRTP